MCAESFTKSELNMKTIGLIPSQQLASLEQNDSGDWINVPDGETVIPLIKTIMPDIQNTEKVEPILVWFNDRVERQWIVSNLSDGEISEKLAKQYPPATMLQARIWMARNGINPTTDIPSIIASAYPDGPQRIEALERWDNAVSVPFNHPLVGIIAESLDLDPASIWSEVLSIE